MSLPQPVWPFALDAGRTTLICCGLKARLSPRPVTPGQRQETLHVTPAGSQLGAEKSRRKLLALQTHPERGKFIPLHRSSRPQVLTSDSVIPDIHANSARLVVCNAVGAWFWTSHSRHSTVWFIWYHQDHRRAPLAPGHQRCSLPWMNSPTRNHGCGNLMPIVDDPARLGRAPKISARFSSVLSRSRSTSPTSIPCRK